MTSKIKLNPIQEALLAHVPVEENREVEEGRRYIPADIEELIADNLRLAERVEYLEMQIATNATMDLALH